MGALSKQQRATLVAALVATLAIAASTCLAMSIETEPVKVTTRNSGPRYDISANDNEVERRPVGPPAGEEPQAPPTVPSGFSDNGDLNGEPVMPIGHLAIRRIYLFPVMTRGDDSSESERPQPPNHHKEHHHHHHHQEDDAPGSFAKPFWPFLTPARPMHRDSSEHARPHLFGADEASRSPARPQNDDDEHRAASGEREGPSRQQPADRDQLIDPIQMMLEMMRQAISAQMVPPQRGLESGPEPQGQQPRPMGGSDNAPSESSASSDERPKMPTELAGPRSPAQNETREDVVEIEGKKYLRKVVVNRHIGDNLIFMTRRLIFVPLNETTTTTNGGDVMPNTTTETVATATNAPATTPAASAGVEEESSTTSIPDRVGDNKPVPTTVSPNVEASSSTTTTTKAPEEAPVTITAKGPEPLSTEKEEVTAAPTQAPVESAGQPASSTEAAPAAPDASTASVEEFMARMAAEEAAAAAAVQEAKPASTTQAPASSEKPQ